VPHQVHERKFGRRTGHRRSMLRNLSLSVLRYERVKTTEAKAKEIRLFVDRMINLGKDGSLDARRRALAWLPEPVIVEKVFSDLAGRWPDRGSGYVRLTHIGRRVGDSAPQMLIELVSAAEKAAEKTDGTAEAAKPRRRLALPRRRTEKKEEPAGAAARPPKAEKAEKKPAKRTTKKTAKGAAT
jgi:large subunit ribosomal protein L17